MPKSPEDSKNSASSEELDQIYGEVGKILAKNVLEKNADEKVEDRSNGLEGPMSLAFKEAARGLKKSQGLPTGSTNTREDVIQDLTRSKRIRRSIKTKRDATISETQNTMAESQPPKQTEGPPAPEGSPAGKSTKPKVKLVGSGKFEPIVPAETEAPAVETLPNEEPREASSTSIKRRVAMTTEAQNLYLKGVSLLKRIDPSLLKTAGEDLQKRYAYVRELVDERNASPKEKVPMFNEQIIERLRHMKKTVDELENQAATIARPARTRTPRVRSPVPVAVEEDAAAAPPAQGVAADDVGIIAPDPVEAAPRIRARSLPVKNTRTDWPDTVPVRTVKGIEFGAGGWLTTTSLKKLEDKEKAGTLSEVETGILDKHKAQIDRQNQLYADELKRKGLPVGPDSQIEIGKAVPDAFKGEAGVGEIEFEKAPSPSIENKLATYEEGVTVATASQAASGEKPPEVPPGLETMDKARQFLVERREERLVREKNLGEKFLGLIKNYGEWYNRQNKYAKIGINASLIATTFLSSGGAGTAAGYALAGAFAVVKSGAAAGLSVSIEQLLEKNYKEKKGKDRGTFTKARHKVEALSLAVLTTFFAGDILKGTPTDNIDKIRHWFSFDSVPGINETGNAPAAQRISQVLDAPGDAPAAPGTAPAPDAPQPVEEQNGASAPKELEPYEINRDDNLYKVLKSNFEEVRGLSGGRQTNFIENVLAEVKVDPSKFIEGADGRTVTNINDLRPGDKINLQALREVIETKEIKGESLLKHAENLSKGAVDQIESYRSEGNLAAAPDSSTAIVGGNQATSVELAERGAQSTQINPNDFGGTTQPAIFHPDQNVHAPDAQELKERIDFDVKKSVDNTVTNLYGSKGILGFFKSDGMATWRNIKDTSVNDFKTLLSNSTFPQNHDGTKNYLSQPSVLNSTKTLFSQLELAGKVPREGDTIGTFVDWAYREMSTDKLKNLSTSSIKLIKT